MDLARLQTLQSPRPSDINGNVSAAVVLQNKAVAVALPRVSSGLVSDHLDLVDDRHVVLARQRYHLHGARGVRGRGHVSLLLPSGEVRVDARPVQVLVDLQRQQTQRAAVQTATLAHIRGLQALKGLICLC